MNRIQRIPEWVWLAGFGFIIFALSYVSPVDYSTSDPFFSLVLSQAIIENGELNLDSYRPEDPQLFETLRYQFINIDGRTYYNFPLGSSFLALPFVWISQALGKDMLVPADNYLVQNFISALLTSCIFVLAYFICRTYLPVFPSFVITLIFVLGTTIISAGGTALWSLTATVFIVLLALILIVRYDSGAAKTVHPITLGVLLFAAYFTRPSSAIFIMVIFSYLLFKNRQELFRAGLIALALLIVFLFFSRFATGAWLPSYYAQPGRFGTENFVRSLSGVLISPSRGLLIYSPFILVILISVILVVPEMRGSLLLLICVIWFIVQVIFVASMRHWWGGFSYGPRLLTDAIPALLIITIILWSRLVQKDRKRLQVGLATPFILLGISAIIIHSVQGLFGLKTPIWNAYPNIDEYSEYLFDWRYPQFLTTRIAFHERLLDHYRSVLERDPDLIDEYRLGDPLSPGRGLEYAYYVGWGSAAPIIYWTEIDTARILFKPGEIKSDEVYILEISALPFGDQVAEVIINETSIGTVTFSGSQATYTLEFAGSIVESGEVNEISIYLPQSRRPGFDDLRDIGLRYWSHQFSLSNVAIKITQK